MSLQVMSMLTPSTTNLLNNYTIPTTQFATKSIKQKFTPNTEQLQMM
ncbi:MAG: hypothetical protein ABI337_01020 [Nitrososphaera sp.]